MTDSALQIVAVCSSVASAGSLTSMTTMTCLATLPTEISHMISSYIDDADLDTMRLVNREVRDSVTDEWAIRNQVVRPTPLHGGEGWRIHQADFRQSRSESDWSRYCRLFRQLSFDLAKRLRLFNLLSLLREA